MKIAIPVFLAAALLAPPAFASEPSPTELAIARRLFQEATELERDQQWALAAARLKEAVQIKDTPGLRFHLAHCEERLGQLVEAMLDYDRARELIAAGARAKDVESLLEPARRALEARIPTLLITTPALGTKLAVELNDELQAQSVVGRPAPLNPGKYRLVVSAPGHTPFERELVLAEGDRKRVEAKLSPLPAPATAKPVAPRAPSSVASDRPRSAAAPPESSNARTYVLVAESLVALAGLGVGVGFFLASNQSNDNAVALMQELPEGACVADSEDDGWAEGCAALEHSIAEQKRTQRLYTAGFIGAGVGAAAFVLTAALWPGSEGTAPRVTAAPERGGVVLGLAGRF